MESDPVNLDYTLCVARRAAAQAGELLRKHFGTAVVTEKESHNLVTEADWAAESLISQILQAAFPTHALWREEAGAIGDQADQHLWVVDPLDGTNNYAHGIPHFSVSIAYLQWGIPQVAVVYDPLRNEMYTAQRGQGAWLNDQVIRVSNRPTISQSVIGTGFYYDRGALMERTLETIHKLFKQNVRGIRRMGGAALDLSYVACGRFEGFFEYRLAPWDYAAGWLLVEEAGGVCFDRKGEPLTIHSQHVIAANPHVAAQFLDLVRWPAEA